jgi:hypothetical protein
MASLCENLLGFGHPMFVSFVTLTGNIVYMFSINDIFNNSYCTVFPFPSSDSLNEPVNDTAYERGNDWHVNNK